MIYVLIFFSGFAGLVYEVLWMKQLGLLFGNTSQAAASTLAAFFGGLAFGSWLWGRRAARMKNGLKAYAGLELGIAITAGLYFVILHIYHALYPMLYQRVGSSGLLLGAKLLLALVLVFPPAMFMGGTIPVIGQYLIRERSGFGRKAAVLYGVNTVGAALGAYMAGFYLPLWLGFRATCLSAMALTTMVAAAALWLSRDVKEETRPREDTEPPGSAEEQEPWLWYRRSVLACICFLSGFGFLALEVLWTRMFVQVLENSVYTFAAILVVVLLCLAAGAFLSSRLARLAASQFMILSVLVLAGGIAVAATPFVFMSATDGMKILAMRASWANYIMMIFGKAVLVIGPPALVLGTVFPFLMKVEERAMTSAGNSLGRLSAVNTVGGILGSLVCGFVFLEAYGMWGTMRMLAVAYLAALAILPIRLNGTGIAVRALGALGIVLLFTAMNPTALPLVSIDPERSRNEEVLETWEGSHGTVAVTRSDYGVTIKLNSHYGLGATGAARQEQIQNDLPLMIFPDTENIFFLGMGTGITAGGALAPEFPNVKKVTVCELVPEVIEAAEKYIAKCDGHDYTQGLFSDPRATVLAEDGRHYLMATDEKFDMINGDLFVPFRAGVGSLYTKEHFQNVKARLKPEGVFFQWIPLYQVTDYEFGVIARTMLEVFDQVSLWRCSFQPGDDVVAVVGHNGKSPLPACDMNISDDKQRAVSGKGVGDLLQLALPFDSQSILFFYCGNISQAPSLFDEYPVNTDDKPVIEYMAPRTYRREGGATIPWFVGPRLARLVEALQEKCPPEQDPLLVNRSKENRRLPVAGTYFYWARVWTLIGDFDQCQSYWLKFLREWLNRD